MTIIETFRDNFKTALLNSNRAETLEVYKKIKNHSKDIDFIEDIMVPTTENIGNSWEIGEVSLSQLYMSGRICEDLISSIFKTPPLDSNSNIKIAIVNFQDHHPLGKKIVVSIFRVNGIPLLDYGHGIDEEELIKKLDEDKPNILIISVLMLPSALKIKGLKERFLKEGIDIKILVGGAPFRLDKDLWKQVGADAMGDKPIDTLNIIKKWSVNNNE